MVPVGTTPTETLQSVGQGWVFYPGIQFVILPKETLLYETFNMTIIISACFVAISTTKCVPASEYLLFSL